MNQNRPFPPFPVQPPPEPRAPPPRRIVLRQRLGKFYSRFHNVLFIAVGVVIALTAMLVYDTTRPLAQHLTQRDIDAAVQRTLEKMPPGPSLATQAYAVIHPSVVSIRTMVGEGKEEGALGTGVVVDEDGTILSSLHILKDATEVIVTFADGFESEAVVIGAQPENDLVVLRALVIPDDLVPAVLTSGATLHVGDEVVAVGNPFGITHSTSAGVVSGLGRNFRSPETGEVLTNLIQFDAAVNPGNSGGPLVNRNGEVVGIVTALFNPSDEDVFIGIGFAVPIESAGGALGSPPY